MTDATANADTWADMQRTIARGMRALLGLVALLGCAAALAAQDLHSDTASALHDGWLCEVLDLDPAGAQRHYEATIAAQDAPAEHKLLAHARLLEWHLDDREGSAPHIRALRADPMAWDLTRRSLNRRISRGGPPRGAPPPTPNPARSEDQQPPPPRPLFAALVPAVEEILASSSRDRQVQSLLARLRRSYRSRGNEAEREVLRRRLRELDPASTQPDQRLYGLQLIEYRLDGRDDLANQFQQMYEREMPPRPRTGRDGERRTPPPPEDTLRRAIAALPPMIERAQDRERELLARLQRRLEELHNSDSAAEGADLVRGLGPYYTRALLGRGRRGR